MAKQHQLKGSLKKIGVLALAVICIILLIFGISDSVFRTKVGVKGFEKELSSVSPATRRALKSELEKIATLNSGETDYKTDYVLREGSVQISEDEETKESYATLYIDSDKLQLSLYAQLNWGSGFRATSEAYGVFISCADESNWQYATNNCITPQENQDYSKIATENILLLDDYGQNNAAEIRDALTSYFLTVAPKSQSLLLQRDSIAINNDALEAKLKLDARIEYSLKIMAGEEIVLSKNNTEVWRYKPSDFEVIKHHASLIENYLPTELRTENGTDFALRWTGGNNLKILPDSCNDGDNDEMLIETAKQWLKDANFAPEDFKISMQKTCVK